MLLDIKEDAIFIADSHYNKERIEFENLLDDILYNNIKTSQLFLMGDNFDFLCDEISYFKTINQNIISKINDISEIIEVIYIEGNHDFNLKDLFQNSTIIKRENQPFIVQYNDENIAISHGDIFTPFTYDFFTLIMRNRYFLKLLNFLDINNTISKYFENKLIKKNICHSFEDFSEFASKRISKYKVYDDLEMIIEGHFHQGKNYDKYINIPSLACGNMYSKVKIIDSKFTLEHLQYS